MLQQTKKIEISKQKIADFLPCQFISVYYTTTIKMIYLWILKVFLNQKMFIEYM